MAVKNFKELFRKSTGKSILDSGGDNGRHWQKSPIKEGNIVRFDKNSEGSDCLSITIETALLLDAAFSIDHELIEKAEEAGKDTVEEYLDEIGFSEVSAHNPYNGENDLSQVYVVRVYSRVGKDYDIYQGTIDRGEDDINDVVVLISAHNGADVRGGYTDSVPIIPKGSYDYIYPIDVTAGFYVSKAWDSDGNVIEKEDLSVDVERWITGYSSSPTHTFSKEIESVINVSDDGQEALVILKSKEKVLVHPEYYI